jgi:hypothetical protein
VNPARPVDHLSRAQVDRLYEAQRAAVEEAVEGPTTMFHRPSSLDMTYNGLPSC